MGVSAISASALGGSAVGGSAVGGSAGGGNAVGGSAVGASSSDQTASLVQKVRLCPRHWRRCRRLRRTFYTKRSTLSKFEPRVTRASERRTSS